MKNIEVKNYRTLKGNTLNITGTDFIVKELIPQTEVSALHANVVEVQPGQTSYSYHWHEKNEEVFFILSGQAIVTTQDKEIHLSQADAITFPAGPKGAHCIRNASDSEPLVYLDFGADHSLEIAHFPRNKQMLILGPYTQTMVAQPNK